MFHHGYELRCEVALGASNCKPWKKLVLGCKTSGFFLIKGNSSGQRNFKFVNESLSIPSVAPWNHRIIYFGKDLQDHQSPTLDQSPPHQQITPPAPNFKAPLAGWEDEAR